jgi:hypothetical protein
VAVERFSLPSGSRGRVRELSGVGILKVDIEEDFS